ncbi:MAG TPA: hypothetical protein PLH57_09030, partial [Oligoflexia bacterium]|nr:hypothetical protein [Oligoflexia bacterium]
GGARLVGKTAAIGMGVGGTLGAGLGKAMSHLTETTPEDAAALEGENRKLRALVSRGLAQESELLSSNVALAEIKNQDPVVNGLITGVIGGLIEADIINNTVVKNLDDIAQDSLKAEARSLEKNARRAAKNLPKARVVKYKTKTATLPQSILGGIGMQYK